MISKIHELCCSLRYSNCIFIKIILINQKMMNYRVKLFVINGGLQQTLCLVLSCTICIMQCSR